MNGLKVVKAADFPAKERRGFSIPTVNYLKDRSLSHVLPHNAYAVWQGLCFITQSYYGSAYTIRNLPPQSFKDRYTNPPLVEMQHHIFQADRLLDRKGLVVVEGPSDAIAAWQLGYDGIALLGAEVPTERIEYLRSVITTYPKGVVFIPDNDKAGLELAATLMQQRLSMRIVHLPINDNVKDLCDLKVPERSTFLQYAFAVR